MVHPRSSVPLALVALLLSSVTTGCGASRKPLRAEMAPAVAMAKPAEPAPLQENVFRRDRSREVSEDAIARVLAAPVFLEAGARLGVVPVATGYGLDDGVPLARVPEVLTDALAHTDLLEVSTEVSTEWPTHRSIAGLRELGTRYRTEYLLLYRHRFVDRTHLNGWAWTYATVLGWLLAPGETLETAGVLEATLFDVRTGTILFSVFERVHAEQRTNTWQHDRKRRALQAKLRGAAAERLADRVVGQIRTLADARTAYDATARARSSDGTGAGSPGSISTVDPPRS